MVLLRQSARLSARVFATRFVIYGMCGGSPSEEMPYLHVARQRSSPFMLVFLFNEDHVLSAVA